MYFKKLNLKIVRIVDQPVPCWGGLPCEGKDTDVKLCFNGDCLCLCLCLSLSLFSLFVFFEGEGLCVSTTTETTAARSTSGSGGLIVYFGNIKRRAI